LHDTAHPARRRGVVKPDGLDPGVRFQRESALLDRALLLLEHGPVTTERLASTALGITGGPRAVTQTLVRTLLRDEPRAGYGRDGLWRLRRPAAAPALGFDRLRFAVVDVETTGTAGRDGHIIEIAIITVDGRNIVDAYSTLVDPGVAVSPWITRLTGIRNAMIRGAPRFADVADEVRRRLRGRVFVAHNAGYDWSFLREELRRIGARVPRGPRLCTVQLTRRLHPGLARRGLDAVAAYYGVEIEERHRARGDAVATARLLLRMLADAERRGWSDWEALDDALKVVRRRGKKTTTGGVDRADR